MGEQSLERLETPRRRADADNVKVPVLLTALVRHQTPSRSHEAPARLAEHKLFQPINQIAGDFGKSWQES
jgi:hypothetical protein